MKNIIGGEEKLNEFNNQILDDNKIIDNNISNFVYVNNYDLIINECMKQSKKLSKVKVKISDIYENENNKGEGLKIIEKYVLIGNALYNKKSTIEDKMNSNYSEYQSILNKLKDKDYKYDKILYSQLNKTNDEILIKLINEYYLTDRTNIINMLNEELFNKSTKKIHTVYYPTNNSLDLLNIESLFINDKETSDIFYNILKNINSVKKSDYDNKIDILLNSHIIIPISNDIMWYNNNNYIYNVNDKTKEFLKENKNIMEKKLFYIIDTINNTISDMEKEGYSKNIPNNLKYKSCFYYNDDENNLILEEYKYTNDPVILNQIQILKEHKNNPYFNINSEYYFNYYTNNSLTSLRNCSIIEKNNNFVNKKNNVEMKTINNSSLNIIGYFITNKDDIKYNDLKEYSYNDFLDQIENKLKDKEVISGYWLFSENDNKRLKSFNNFENNNLLCKAISEQLFDDIITININIINNKLKKINNYEELLLLINNQFDKLKGFNNKSENKELYTLNDTLNNYKTKWNIEIQNIIYKFLTTYNKKNKDITKNKYDKLYGFENIIKLPEIKDINKDKILNIEINKDIINKNNDNINGCICQHYISWNELNKSYKTKNNDYEKLLNQFMSEFVSINAHKEYICKICGDKLDISTYVQDGQFSNNIFIATDINISIGKIEDNPKYSMYKGIYGIINGIKSRIINYAKLFNIYEYQDINKKQKEGINQLTKDTIDLINYNLLLWKDKYNEYNKNKETNYNINPNISDFFIFPFNNELYDTHTEFKDIHKTIKQNNASIYICILFINLLSKDQILNLSMNKDCNYDIFEKLFNKILNNIKIQIDKNNIVNINKYPILCYIIYNFSYNLVHYNRYKLNNKSNNEEITTKEKIALIIKCMITIIDIINTINIIFFDLNNNDVDLNSDIFNYYQKYYLKFQNRLIKIYNDTSLIPSLRYNKDKIIDIAKFNNNDIILGYDIDYNKVNYFKYLEKLDNFVILPQYNNIILNNENKHNQLLYNDLEFNKYTTCKDGQPHEWDGEDKLIKGIKCKICNIDYDNLNKITYKNIKDNVENYYLNKISLKFCPNGLAHIFNEKRKCTICGYIEGEKMKEKDLKELKNNYYNKKIIEEKDKKEELKIDEKKIKLYLSDKIINEELKLFINKVKKFYDIIEENNVIINIDKTSYTFNYNYNGNKLDKPLILDEDNIKHTELNGKKVFYYKQKDITIYYNEQTLSLIGYKVLNKNFVEYNAYLNCRCIINYSLSDILTYLFIPKYVDNNKFIYLSNEDILNTYYNNICNFLNKINILLNKINNNKNKEIKSNNNKNQEGHIKTIDDIIKYNNNYINELVKSYEGKYNKFIIDNKCKETLKYIYLETINKIKDYDKKDYLLSLQLFNEMNFNTFYNFSLVYLLKRLNDILNNDSLMTKIIIKLITYEYNNNYQNFQNINLVVFGNIIYASPTYNEYLTYDINLTSESEISTSEEELEENGGFDIDNFRDVDENGEIISDDEDYENFAYNSD